MRQFKVVENFLRQMDLEIPCRQRGEMRVDFLVAERFRREVAHFLKQRLALFLLRPDEFRAAGQQRHRARMQLPEQANP